MDKHIIVDIEKIPAYSKVLNKTTLSLDLMIFYILFTLAIQINSLKIGGKASEKGIGNKANSYNILAKHFGSNGSCTNVAILFSFLKNVKLFAPLRTPAGNATKAAKERALKERDTILEGLIARKPGKLQPNTISQASSTTFKAKHMNGARAQWVSITTSLAVFNYEKFPELVPISTIEDVLSAFNFSTPEPALLDTLKETIKNLLLENPALDKSEQGSPRLLDPFNIADIENVDKLAGDNLTPLERTLGVYRRNKYEVASDVTMDFIQALGDDFDFLEWTQGSSAVEETKEAE